MKHTTLILNGNRWKYRRVAKIVQSGERLDGQCDWEKKTIRIDRALHGLDEMETDIHEIDHARHEYLHEDAIGPGAKEKAAAYWKLGYRKLTPEQLKVLGFI